MTSTSYGRSGSSANYRVLTGDSLENWTIRKTRVRRIETYTDTNGKLRTTAPLGKWVDWWIVASPSGRTAEFADFDLAMNWIQADYKESKHG